MKYTQRFLFLSLTILALTAACKSQMPVEEEPPAIDKIRDIYAGTADVFVLMADKTLWGAGNNRSGQLGVGKASAGNDARGEAVIVRINDGDGNPFSGVKAAAAGESHALVLKDDGTLWGAGNSSSGELGLKEGKLLVFTQLKAGDSPLSGVQSVMAGNNSSFIIQGDGSLWATGYNYYGELGLGNRDTQFAFVKTGSTGLDVKALASGLRHTVLLKEDGTIWTSGNNFNGQLGLGDADDRISFTRVESAGSDNKAVAAGNYHTVILKNDGSVWTAGSNVWGQLGFSGSGDLRAFTRVLDENGQPLADVTEIAARGNITVLVKVDGGLLLAGNYADTEGTKDADPAAFFADGDDPAGKLDTGKTAFASLIPEDGAPEFGGVKKLVLGYNSIYVISSDGLLWAAGSNRYGQLSLGLDTENIPALKLIDYDGIVN